MLTADPVEFGRQMGSRPPLSGYNHNIRYGDRIYHVQTEESGLENPHIFTHLFLGGMIISSAKTDYADLVGKPECDEKVRKLMQEQHKRLMKALRGGEYDAKIVEMVGSVQPLVDEAAEMVEISEAAGQPEAGAQESPELAAEEMVAVAPPPAFVPAAATLAGAEQPDLPPAPVAEELLPVPELGTATLPDGAMQPVPGFSAVGLPDMAATQPLPHLDPSPDVADTQPLPSPAELAAARVRPLETVLDDSHLGRRQTSEDATIPYKGELQKHAAGAAPAPPPTPEASARVAASARPSPAIQVSVTERPYDSDLEEKTERVEIEERFRQAEPKPPAQARHPSQLSPAVPPRSPSQMSPAIPPRSPSQMSPAIPPRSPSQMSPAIPPRSPSQMSPAVSTARLPGQSSPTPMPALPRISRTAMQAVVQQQQAGSDHAAIMVDRPAADVDGPPPLITPTFYSQPRRRVRASEEAAGVGRPRPSPGPIRPQASRVFGKPVPGAPPLPPVDERTPVGPIHSRRSGVYPIPGLGGPGPDRPHPDPHVRATSRPSTTTSYGSTPQRYTAPSRMPGPAVPRRRPPTGTYERVGASRGPAARLPEAPRPGITTEPRVSMDAQPGRPRPPVGPGMKPLPRVGRQPGVETPAVVARPAVIIGDADAPRRTDRPAVSGQTRHRVGSPLPPPTTSGRSPLTMPTAKGGAPGRVSPPAATPSGATPATPPQPPRASPPGSMFGAGLITERSLDEVILSYLAEDVEADE